MQLVLNFRNVAVGAAMAVAGYYAYSAFVVDIQTDDVAALAHVYREATPARQIVIKQRIRDLYKSSRDYGTMVVLLDSPSPVCQALAVDVLASRGEHKALPELLKRLDDPERAPNVKESLATAMGRFAARQAIPRLIELTDASEDPDARIAAHDALQALTSAGAAVKFGEAAREHWTLWWRDHRTTVN